MERIAPCSLVSHPYVIGSLEARKPCFGFCPFDDRRRRGHHGKWVISHRDEDVTPNWSLSYLVLAGFGIW